MAHLARSAGHLVVPGCVADLLLFALCIVACGCGGKVVGDANADPDPTTGGGAGDDVTPGSAPPPTTCEAICTHVVGSCAPGASTAACLTPCEKTRAIPTCPAQRDAYLACLITVPVTCTGSEVVIVGCSDERRAFERCTG
jgi:hypothetical protein